MLLYSSRQFCEQSQEKYRWSNLLNFVTQAQVLFSANKNKLFSLKPPFVKTTAGRFLFVSFFVCVSVCFVSNSRPTNYSQTGCSFPRNFANFRRNVGILIGSLLWAICNRLEQLARDGCKFVRVDSSADSS